MSMRKLPLIKSVMTPFPYSVDIHTLLRDAGEYMRRHNIHHLPVTDGESLVGVLHEKDVTGNPDVSAADLELEIPCVFDLNDRLDNVLSRMADGHIDTVLVTRNRKLAGIFTVTDACSLFAGYLRDEFGPSGGDEAA